MRYIFGNRNPLLGGDTLSVARPESSDTLAAPLPTVKTQSVESM